MQNSRVSFLFVMQARQQFKQCLRILSLTNGAQLALSPFLSTWMEPLSSTATTADATRVRPRDTDKLVERGLINDSFVLHFICCLSLSCLNELALKQLQQTRNDRRWKRGPSPLPRGACRRGSRMKTCLSLQPGV